MKPEWSHLPNTAHIDRILAHLKARPDRWSAARGTARDAIMALVAWDDCACVLDMPVDAVKFMASNEYHPAVLLLPAVLAMEEK